MALTADSKELYIAYKEVIGTQNADGSYSLPALSLKGLNDLLYAIVKKIQGNITLADLTDLAVDTLTAVTVITQNLYSTYGDVVELTVDRLITENKVTRYADSDTSDINYVWVQDQFIKFITGETDGSTTQHIDRDGNLLYWKDATMQSMGTDITAYPVTVYVYTELCKLQISFDEVDGVYVPRMTIGAGDGVTEYSGKAVIYKPSTQLQITYYQSGTGDAVQLSMNDDKEIRCAGNVGAGFSARNIGFGASLPTSGYQDYDLFVVTS